MFVFNFVCLESCGYILFLFWMDWRHINIFYFYAIYVRQAVKKFNVCNNLRLNMMFLENKNWNDRYIMHFTLFKINTI